MAHPEQVIRLDTQAWKAAYTTRLTRTSLYWLVLLGAAGLVGVGLAVIAGRLAALSARRTQAPHPAAAGSSPSALKAVVRPGIPHLRGVVVPQASTTPVVVWNDSGHAGWATRTAHALTGDGYPIGAAANATHTVRGGVLGEWVFYTPGHVAAAVGVARRLRLDPRMVVRPLDGVSPTRIAPAVVLVLRGR